MDTELAALKTASKKVVHKAAEATGEFLRNKIADKIVKPKHVIDENLRNGEDNYSVKKKRINIKQTSDKYHKNETL